MLFESVFNHALDAILLADDDQRYVAANPAACELTGYGRDELLTMGVGDLAAPGELEVAHATWAAFVTDGRSEGIFRLCRKDGAVVETEFRAVVDVGPGIHLSVMRDVTDARRAQRDLEAHVETLRTLETQRSELIRELLDAREDERGRLARALHDDLGQILTSVEQRVAGLGMRTGDELQVGIDDIHDLIQQAVDATHALVARLREGSGADPALEASLHRLASEVESVHGVAVEVSVDVESELLPLPVSTAAHRIASEALTYAVKHAKATVVSIVAARVADRLVLVVEDDGIGFDPDATVRPLGDHGLVGMRTCAEEVDGSITVAASPGRGTAVRADLPLSP